MFDLMQILGSVFLAGRYGNSKICVEDVCG